MGAWRGPVLSLETHALHQHTTSTFKCFSKYLATHSLSVVLAVPLGECYPCRRWAGGSARGTFKWLFADLQLLAATKVKTSSILLQEQAGARISCVSQVLPASPDSQASSNAEPQAGGQNLEDAGIVNSFGEVAKGIWVGMGVGGRL